jgi:hypothetical protein
MISLGYPELSAAVRALVALIFASAALAKMRHWSTFEGVIANYRLLPEIMSRPFAWALPPLELAVAVLALFGRFAGEMAAAVLLLLFAFAMGINLLRGRSHIDCGCFSSALRQPLRWTLVARNAALVLLLLVGGGPAARPDQAFFMGTLSGIALFVIVQCLNALLAIPGARRGHAHQG